MLMCAHAHALSAKGPSAEKTVIRFSLTQQETTNCDFVLEQFCHLQDGYDWEWRVCVCEMVQSPFIYGYRGILNEQFL